LHPTTLKNPTKNLSSPPSTPKSPKSIKTNHIKGEKRWHTSFGQFGKIEVEGKTAGPAQKAGPSHLATNQNRMNTLRRTKK
jgi:hypothetical protein